MTLRRTIIVALVPWLAVALAAAGLLELVGRRFTAPDALGERGARLASAQAGGRELELLITQSAGRVRSAQLDERVERRGELLGGELQRLVERSDGALASLEADLVWLDAEAARFSASGAGTGGSRQALEAVAELGTLLGDVQAGLGDLISAGLDAGTDELDDAAFDASLDAQLVAARGIERTVARAQLRLRALDELLAAQRAALDTERELERGRQGAAGMSLLALGLWGALAAGALATFLAVRRIAPGNPDVEQRAALMAVTAALETERERNAAFETRLTADASARRRVEQELALLQLYHATLVDNVRHGLVVTDAALRLQFFNRAAAGLLGFETADTGRTFDEVAAWAHVLLPPGTAVALSSALVAGTVQHFEAIRLPAGAREVHVDVTVSPYTDETGRARGVLVLLEDVTEATAIRHRLFEAERLATMGRLAAQVAHEVRNPLSSIALHAELLRDELQPAGVAEQAREARRLIDVINGEIERLGAITERYLDQARLPGPELRSGDLNALVRATFAFVGAELRAQRIEAVLALAAVPLPVLVDEGQFRQALINMIRNSCEAMPAGGTITAVTARRRDDTIELRLVDRGPGVPEAVRHRIFEPFFTTKTSGTGLGLSITAQIVREHGGTIGYEPAPDGGACFVLTLPAVTGGAGEPGGV